MGKQARVRLTPDHITRLLKGRSIIIKLPTEHVTQVELLAVTERERWVHEQTDAVFAEADKLFEHFDKLFDKMGKLFRKKRFPDS